MIINLPKELKMDQVFHLGYNFTQASHTQRMCIWSNSFYCYTFNKKKKKYVFNGIAINKEMAIKWLDGKVQIV